VFLCKASGIDFGKPLAVGETALALCRRCTKRELKPVEPGKTITTSFHWGFGDLCNFAHILELYRRRGWQIEIECDPGKECLVQAAGAKYVPHSPHNHGWHDIALQTPEQAMFAPWKGNKISHNVGQRPLPDLKMDRELWKELCAVKLAMDDKVTPEHRQTIDGILALLPAYRPLVLLHAFGDSSQGEKNYGQPAELCQAIMDTTDCSLLLLDWDGRVPSIPRSERFLHLGRDCPRFWGVLELYELQKRAALMIGVDSGPMHFLRYTDTLGLMLWRDFFPANVFLPRERTLHLIPSVGGAKCHTPTRIPITSQRYADRCARAWYNTIVSPDGYPSPEWVADQVRLLLGAPVFLKNKARDLQFRTFLDYTGPRARTFGLAAKFLLERPSPVVVETGTIDREENWGDGWFTYLFGLLLAQHGGKLHSIDRLGPACHLAQMWTLQFGAVKVHSTDSVGWLEQTEEKIDLLYCDTDGPADLWLREVKAAAPKMGDGAILLDGAAWYGQGAQAVGFLLESGWDIIYAGHQTFLRRTGL
jgi:hypothetical protein